MVVLLSFNDRPEVLHLAQEKLLRRDGLTATYESGPTLASDGVLGLTGMTCYHDKVSFFLGNYVRYTYFTPACGLVHVQW